jgi:hypothetical protein
MRPKKWETGHRKVTDKSIRGLPYWCLRVLQAQDEQLEECWLVIFDERLEAHAETLGQTGQQVQSDDQERLVWLVELRILLPGLILYDGRFCDVNTSLENWP